MKILVALKQVPARDARLRVNAAGAWIDESDLEYELNEPDAYALEAALELKDRHGGEVAVVSAGPERAARAIREALAKGADRGIHIETEAPGGGDPLRTAWWLAQAAAAERPELILTGLQSEDAGYGQTGVLLAELLGWPHATLIVEIEKPGAALRLRRELEAGRFQYLELPLPAVVAVQSGIRPLRYATLMGIKRAKTKPFSRLDPSAWGPPPEPAFLIERIYVPERGKRTEFLEGTAEEIAAKLVDRLRAEALLV